MNLFVMEEENEIYIARDISGSLWLFLGKPEKDVKTGKFYHNGYPFSRIEKNLFPDLIFDNSPIKYTKNYTRTFMFNG